MAVCSGKRVDQQRGSAVLSVQNLTVEVTHSGHTLRLANAVSFEVYPGEVIDLIGPSGSGKSTLLLAIARLRPKISGDLVLCGQLLEKMPAITWRQHVIYVPQKATLTSGSVLENLLLPWRLGCRKMEQAPEQAAFRKSLDAIGLCDVELDRPAERLSGGQAARVALLRALSLNAPLYLLDEVDAALDDASASLIGAFIAQRAQEGQAFMRVRHRAPDGFATRRLRLESGQIFEETTELDTSLEEVL
jgi:putative ABC transport system ATP-binding protein